MPVKGFGKVNVSAAAKKVTGPKMDLSAIAKKPTGIGKIDMGAIGKKTPFGKTWKNVVFPSDVFPLYNMQIHDNY